MAVLGEPLIEPHPVLKCSLKPVQEASYYRVAAVRLQELLEIK